LIPKGNDVHSFQETNSIARARGWSRVAETTVSEKVGIYGGGRGGTGQVERKEHQQKREGKGRGPGSSSLGRGELRVSDQIQRKVGL
jgi:hypothetical protein